MIRERVLRAIALNRTPGYHFAGNFIDLSFDRVSSGDTRISYDTGPLGGNDIGSLALAADFALGTAIRADLDRATRTATVSMSLDFGAPLSLGTVRAASRCHGYVGEGYGRIGRARVTLDGPDGEIGYGSGAFMILKPPPNVTMHPVPHRKRGDAEPPARHRSRSSHPTRRPSSATPTKRSSARRRRGSLSSITSGATCRSARRKARRP